MGLGQSKRRQQSAAEAAELRRRYPTVESVTHALRAAVREQADLSVVAPLLRDPRVNLARLPALTWSRVPGAGWGEHDVELVRLLLGHGSSLPMRVREELLLRAAAHGNESVVRLLLDDRGFDDTSRPSRVGAVALAVRAGQPGSLRLLLADPRVYGVLPPSAMAAAVRGADGPGRPGYREVLQQLQGQTRIQT
jgi:hypothetical protein